MTAGAVSQQVKALEADLGPALLIRLNRAVRPTETGRVLAFGLSDGFARLRDAVDRARPARRGATLTVSCGPPFAAKWLAPRLGSFLEQNPRIDLRIAANLALVDLANGEADVAIRLSRADDPGLHVVPLRPERVAPLASPELAHRLGPDMAVALGDAPLLHDESLAFDPDAPTWVKVFRDLGLPAAQARRGARFGAYADQALDAAAAGAGVVLGRLVLAERDLKTGRLVKLLPDEMPTSASYRAACAPGRQTEPALRAFLDWLVAASL